MIPQDIVCEFMGGFAFTTNSERDAEIAEQIAGYNFISMPLLISTCRGMIETKKLLEKFDKYVEQCRINPYFIEYF